MSSYTFTAPNGEQFVVDVPNGVSQAEAQAAFNKQYNSGSLNNVGLGQSIKGLSKSASQAQSTIAKLGNLPVPTAATVNGFAAKPGQAVSPAQVLQQLNSATGQATKAIGSLAPAQVNGMLAQASAAVGQTFNAVSLDKGIGKFGLTPQQLEQQGYLKPGTVQQFIGNNPNADFTKILANPTVWSGKGGVTSLTGFLNNPNAQTQTQNNLMAQGLAQMNSIGLTTGKEAPQQLSALVQGAAKFGVGAMAAWSKGLAPAALVGAINSLAKGAQYAVDLVSNKLPKSVPSLTGAIDTVNRDVLDSSITDSFNNSKVEPLSYGPIQRTEEGPDPNKPAIERFIDAAEKFLQRTNYYQQEAQDLNTDLISLEAGVITRGEWNLVNEKFQGLRTQYNNEFKTVRGELESSFNALPASVKPNYQAQYDSLIRLLTIVFNFLTYLKKRIADDELLIGT